MNDKVTKLIEIHKKLLNFVDTELADALQMVKTYQGFKDTCIYLFAKSTKTYRAIQYLCGNGIGYGEDAIILSRSLLENLINLAYMANPQQEEEREHRAKLFVGWIIIDSHRKAKGLKCGDPIKKQLEKNLETYNPDFDIDELYKQECTNHKTNGKNPKNYSWSGLSIKDMAEEIGLLDLYYDKVYWLYSQIVHPHPGGSASYMKYAKEGGISINTIPDKDWIDEALVSSIDCYIRMAGLINNVFDIKLYDNLKQIDTEAASLVKEL